METEFHKTECDTCRVKATILDKTPNAEFPIRILKHFKETQESFVSDDKEFVEMQETRAATIDKAIRVLEEHLFQ